MNENGTAHLILSPGRIVMLYATIGLGWITVSDLILMGMTNAGILSVAKGCLFVFLTSCFLYALIIYYSREVKRSRDIFYKAFQISPDSININRLRDGAFIHVNEGFSRMSGYDEVEVIGKTPQQIKLWQKPEELLELATSLERCGTVDSQSTMFRKKDGSSVTGVLSARLIELYGEECVITIVRDISERLKAEEEIQQLVYYDAETGLPNQNLLMDRLNQAIIIDSREKRTTAIIYVGLSGFTNIVDALGHGGGREIARSIAQRFRTMLRQSDTVARINRDEFVIVLGGPVLEADIAVILNKLQAMFSGPIAMTQGEMMLSAAIGVACFPADGFTVNILLQNAHIAMNQARDQGSNCFQFYSEDLNSKAVERHRIEASMLRALEEKEFYLCYQPKFALKTGKVTGMEALLRWKRPGSGVISPVKFIPIAEENGMIVKLGEWVLKTACEQCRAWQDNGLPPLQISVNISTRQLRDNLFVEKVLSILAMTGLPPRFLELELTESSLMGDTDDTVCKLLKLKEKGIAISIDDFGTGYSSLSYLKHLPIDKIKIDRSFVSEVVTNPDDAAIVDAIIAMANSLHLVVVAEGVETAAQLEFLKKRACHEVQGFYYSKPLEALKFEDFMRTGTTGQLHDETCNTPDSAQLQSTTESGSFLQPVASSLACSAAMPVEYIADILLQPVPVGPGDTIPTVLNRFQNDRELLVLPVVDNGHVVGVLNRAAFLEEHIIGRHGFGFHINHSKKIRDLMSSVELILDASTSIEEAAQAIQSREPGLTRIDNICVTGITGEYAGVVDVKKFVNAMAEINISLAKGANPLTGLPGNESIQREINHHLESGKVFDIAYIDIDNFKPYNDSYGFQKGDVVIKALAEIIAFVVQRSEILRTSFYGHIGGDDFILITNPNGAHLLATEIIGEFEGHLPLFHGETDFKAKCYIAANRKGQEEVFGLLSLSIGILNTQLIPVNSYAQLASLATDVKKAAKGEPGSSVVINRRAK